MGIRSATIGYPRIGKNREVKRALEAYWAGKTDAETLISTVEAVQEDGWRAQQERGVDAVAVEGISLYDHVLDWVVWLGLVPERFRHLEGLEAYFAMARGLPGIPALELTKWFDTNYHYLVPEIARGQHPAPSFEGFFRTVERARGVLGARAVPVVLGPVTLLRLARLEEPLGAVLERLLPAYRALLEGLRGRGVAEVQFHEPALVLGDADTLRTHVELAYAELARAGIAIDLVTYFDDLGKAYPWVAALPVAALSLDFTRGNNLELIEAHGWPREKRLGAGVVDARNVWRVRPAELLPLLERLHGLAPELSVQPSASLQFVPYDASRETGLPEALRGVLSFAEQKLEEVVVLARRLEGRGGEAELARIEAAWEAFRAFSPENPAVRKRLQELTPQDFRRALPYAERRPKQIQTPLFPTTTIGSFPQTPEVRRVRARYRKGEISEEAYRAAIDAWIAYAIGVQEGIGLDVLVHGEFERTDMVEYFGQKLEGFAFTVHGWVQSYGSRYVRPPIIYGDVARPEPLTVREFKVAQSYTDKPVKGMLTGPVTILNWSYPRTDIPRKEVAFQIALALRDEVADLEAAGARVIQVDEPALREGLPLKQERWDAYLSWAVDAFRLTTAVAKPETQVHTHMCYSEFGDILAAIDRLDADVISIENARSGDETLRELAEYGYPREVGPGVYDVHSPVVPEAEAILAKLRTFLRHLRPEQIWVNPDCGLKTRRWEEVIPTLRNLVAAARALREEVRAAKG